MVSRNLVGWMATGLLASITMAQPIIVEVRLAGQPLEVIVNGQPRTDPAFNANVPIEFDLPPTFTGELSVRIYDSTLGTDGQPDEDIGSVTINGGQPGTTSRMDFLVAGVPSFPFDPTLRIEARGVRSFGVPASPGIPASAGLTITNPTLRRQTRVAIATVTDIRGDITAGQMFRIQAGIANQFGNPLFSGEVSANITAINRDREWIANAGKLKAVEEINIVGVLSGNVHAIDFAGYTPGDEDSYANIGRVIIRGTAQYQAWDLQGDFFRQTAIVGNILAETGRITEIYTVGSIGAVPQCPQSNCFPGIQPTILAADGIDRIETRALENTDTNWLVNAVDGDLTIVRATITANHKNTQANEIAESAIDDDGTIYLIATQGRILGDIVANNLTYDRSGVGPFPLRAGIFAKGGVQGTIRIEHLVDGADIVSPGGLSSVYIGRQLRGSIVEKVIYAEQGSTGGTSNPPGLPGPQQECTLQLVQIGIPDA